MNAPAVRLAILLATAAPASGARAEPPPPAVPDLSLPPRPHASETRCGACHTTADWREVGFAHDRSGFPLTGRHAEAACQGCHRGGDVRTPVPRACAACHRDVHAGRMGARCEECHDAVDWREEGTRLDAHRRTAFPLSGRHAAIPCEECHGDRRDRGFSRPTPSCLGCHALDYGPRASAAGVDHLAAGFGEDCRACHGTWRFSGGRFRAHDGCFQITAGPHAGISCRGCHDAGLPAIPAGGALTCATDTADCLRCHTTPAIDAKHQGVAGFQPINRRCYECHRFAGG